MSAIEKNDETAGRQTRRVRQRKDRLLRWGLLATVLVAVTGIGLWHQRAGSPKPVGVDALCPFGGLETFWSLVTTGALLQRIAVSSVVLLLIAVVLAVVFGRAFCGYLCPLGFLQELFGKLRRLFGMKRQAQLPARLDRPARWLKYALLVVIALWTWSAAGLVIRAYDPWAAWMHVSSAELLSEFGIGAAVLVLSLVASVVYERFFCRYLCPMGALLGTLKPLSLFHVRRDTKSCIGCGACDMACPMGIQVSETSSVDSAECISCNECVNACPVAGVLEVGMKAGARDGAGKRKALSVRTMVVTMLAIITIGIAGATVTGSFAWTMPSAAESVGGQGEDGRVDAEAIKGWMTMEEVAKAAGIDPARLGEAFGVPEADLGKPMKDITGTYGFDVEQVREHVEAAVTTAP